MLRYISYILHLPTNDLIKRFLCVLSSIHFHTSTKAEFVISAESRCPGLRHWAQQLHDAEDPPLLRARPPAADLRAGGPPCVVLPILRSAARRPRAAGPAGARAGRQKEQCRRGRVVHRRRAKELRTCLMFECNSDLIGVSCIYQYICKYIFLMIALLSKIEPWLFIKTGLNNYSR
jgi:hypothetical protein